MRHRLLILLVVLVARDAWAEAQGNDVDAEIATSAEQEPVEAAPDHGVNGLYPLWEHTASLHANGTGQFGWQHAQLALGPVQVGTQPFLDLYGIWNAQLKLRLWQHRKSEGALIIGGFWVPSSAEARAIGNLHASGFGNPFAAVWLFPIAFAKSWRFHPRFDIHWTSALLLSYSLDPANKHVSLGQNFLARLHASRNWSVRMHAGLGGVLVQPVAHVGLSGAYGGKNFSVAAGMARRLTFDGEASNVAMFDVAVLFR